MNKIDLYSLGLSERYTQEATMYGENLYIGRVSVQYKDMYKVITENGEIFAEVSGKLGYSSINSIDYPAVGDWVLLDRLTDKNGNAIIHHVLMRKSFIERKVAGNRSDSQVIAANVDTVFICMSLNSDFNIRRLERYISMVYDSMANPVIVLTKADLCDNIDDKILEIQEVAIAMDILVTSSMANEGYLDMIKYIDKGKTVAFIGSSGVGKSTLINKIMGEEVLKTNGIRNDDKGKHTTTHRQLLLIPNGGAIVDTPGMKEIGMISGDLEKSFSDIDDLSRQCKFSDCQHKNEPKCAVRQAIEDGIIDEGRLESYRKFQKEIKYNDLRAKQKEREKISKMFGSMGQMKQAIRYAKEKNERR